MMSLRVNVVEGVGDRSEHLDVETDKDHRKQRYGSERSSPSRASLRLPGGDWRGGRGT